jgi:hypothetical protein
VLDHILAQGLPSERFAIRFNAGFAPAIADAETLQHRHGQRSRSYDRVLIKLVCCAD